MVMAVRSACNTVQKRHPVVDAGFLQLVTLLQYICGGVALVDTLQSPIITAFDTEGYFTKFHFFQAFKLFHGLVANICYSRSIKMHTLNNLSIDNA